MRVERDQEKFFDEFAAIHGQRRTALSFFAQLAEAEIYDGIRWLTDKTTILDYGCGVGEGINSFLRITNSKSARFIGIDLSKASIEIAKNRYPAYQFYVVPNNDLSFMPPCSIDGAYMFSVLHHSEHHQKIFDEISRVLERGGKFLIVDLTKNNPFIEFAHALFPYMPKRIKRMFPDDLVIDDVIPEKLIVDVRATIDGLRKAGFAIEFIEYGHLFFFLFDWIERITGLRLSKTKFNFVYLWFYNLEKSLLRLTFVRNRAHLFAIRAVKL